MDAMKKVEKKYLDLYKKYRRKKITAGQFRDAAQDMHCTQSGGTLMRLGENAVWYRFENGQWVFDSYLKSPRNRRALNILTGVEKRHLALRIIAAAVAVLVTLSLLFPDNISTAYSTLFARDPEYQSPKIVRQMTDAIRILSPKGALSREDQQFTVRELSEDETGSLIEQTTTGIIPLYAFAFSGGLNEDEMFRREVTVDVDLSKTGIAEDLYPYLVPVRLHGTIYEAIPFTMKGNILSLSASRESVTVISLGVTLVVGLLLGGAVNTGMYNSDAFGGVASPWFDYSKFIINGDKYKDYIIYCHDKLSPVDIQSIKQRESAILIRYGFVWDPNLKTYVYGNPKATPADVAKILKRMANHPDYVKIQEDASRIPIPDAVANVVNAIKTAHDYLTDVCKLEPPGTVTFIIPEVWTDGANALAIESKATGRSPIIKINPSVTRIGSLSADKKQELLDDLLVTLTHEMFHAIQHRYFNSDTQDAMWFSEATAVLLEQNCVDYYKAKGIISYYSPSNTDYYALLKKGTGSGLSLDDGRHIGYTLSNVLKYKQDNRLSLLSGVGKNDYLAKLMTYYKSVSNCNAVYSVGGNTDDLLTDYFRTQYQAMISDPREPKNIQVTAARQAFLIGKAEEKPFSFNRIGADVNIPVLSAGGLQDSALFLLVDEKGKSILNGGNINILYSPDSANLKSNRAWVKIDSKSGVCPLDPKTKTSGLIACVINEKNDAVSGSADLSLVVAPKPEKIKSVRYDKEMMCFEVELESDPAAAGSPRKGRAVEVTVPGTGIEMYRKYVKPGENTVKISVLELLSKGKSDSTIFEKWAGTLMSTAVKTSVRLMFAGIKAQEKDVFKSGDDPLTLSINESYTVKNQEGTAFNLVHELRKQGFPSSISFDIYTDDYFTASFSGNNGLNLDFRSRLSDYFKYFRFMNLNPKAGIDYDALAKKLAEMDGEDVFFAVRDVYSIGEVQSVDNAVPCENSLNKTADIILGPKSDEKSLLTSGLAFDRKSIPEGDYSGKFIFDISNNFYSVISSERAAYKDVRVREQAEREVQEYIKEGTHSQEDIAAERKRVTRAILEDEKEFDDGFQKSMDELNKELNNIIYYLKVTSQTTAVMTMEGLDENYDCALVPAGKYGVYDMTVQFPDGPVTVKFVVTPNGEIITGSALAIMTKK